MGKNATTVQFLLPTLNNSIAKALQESKWPFAGNLKSKESVTYYSGTDSCSGTGGGVGFAVRRVFVETVTGFVTISERVCNIRIREKFKNTSLN